MSFSIFLPDLNIQDFVALYHGDPRFAYEYAYKVKDRNVRFICLNTSWLSERHDKQAHLYVPPGAIPDYKLDGDIVISVLHHPLNWIDTKSTWTMRPKLEKLSDFILSGHEHQSQHRSQVYIDGVQNAWLEAGPFQESPRVQKSEFGVIVIDTNNNRQKIGSFAWNGNYYESSLVRNDDTDEFGMEWAPFVSSELADSYRFQTSVSHQRFLDELTLPLESKNSKEWTLADLFVYPDLDTAVSSPMQARMPPFKSESLSKVLSEPKVILITGDSDSGKTSLGKILFRDLLSNQFIPVFVSARNMVAQAGNMEKSLHKLIVDQYSELARSRFLQEPRSKRVVILDDCEALLSSNKGRKIYDGIVKFSDRILMLGDKTAQQAVRMEKSRIFTPDMEYAIRPMGFLRRDDLIDKWYAEAREVTLDSEELESKIGEVRSRLDTAIGRDMVPAYPPYVVTMLQVFDSSALFNPTTGTQGAYYEALIKLAIIRRRDSMGFDSAMGMLVRMALTCFLEKKTGLLGSEFEDVRRGLAEDSGLRVSDIPTAQILSSTRLLYQEDGIWSFRHRYVRHYFVALGISDLEHDESYSEIVDGLVDGIGRVPASDVLLFLVHVSSNQYVIRRILEHARGLLRGYPSVDLVNKAPSIIIEGIGGEELGLEAPETADDTTANRQRMLKLADEAVDSLEDEDVEHVVIEMEYEEVDVPDFVVSLRTVECLGVILKNFPVKVPKATKIEIVREAFDLGKRVIARYFEIMEEHEKELVAIVKDIMSSGEESLSAEEEADVSRKFTSMTLQSMLLGLMSTVASSMSTTSASIIYEHVMADSKNLADRYIYLQVQLRTSGRFPLKYVNDLIDETSDKPLARRLVTLMVLAHLHTFPVSKAVRDSVLGKLRIKYPQRFNPTRESMMLPGG